MRKLLGIDWPVQAKQQNDYLDNAHHDLDIVFNKPLTPMIGWLSHSRNLRVASTRIRGELMIRALRAAGTSTSWFDPQRSSTFSTLVIGKRHDLETIRLTETFQQQGGKIIVDLCDNRLEYPVTAVDLAEQAMQLRQLFAIADHVVVSTPTLADRVRDQVHSVRGLSVIGDLADDLSVVPTRITHLAAAKLGASRTLRRLRALRRSGYTLLVWFGSHGGPYADAGMADLLRIQTQLEQMHAKFPIALTVISNSEEKFRQHIQSFAIPTLYAAWDSSTFNVLLQAHDISVIPIGINPFTSCKTDNRVVTSLMNGLAVIADEIPSYTPYREAIGLNDWQRHLSRYLLSPSSRIADVAAGKIIASRLTDRNSVVAQWQQVFAAVRT